MNILRPTESLIDRNPCHYGKRLYPLHPLMSFLISSSSTESFYHSSSQDGTTKLHRHPVSVSLPPSINLYTQVSSCVSISLSRPTLYLSHPVRTHHRQSRSPYCPEESTQPTFLFGPTVGTFTRPLLPYRSPLRLFTKSLNSLLSQSFSRVPVSPCDTSISNPVDLNCRSFRTTDSDSTRSSSRVLFPNSRLSKSKIL